MDAFFRRARTKKANLNAPRSLLHIGLRQCCAASVCVQSHSAEDVVPQTCSRKFRSTFTVTINTCHGFGKGTHHKLTSVVVSRKIQPNDMPLRARRRKQAKKRRWSVCTHTCTRPAVAAGSAVRARSETLEERAFGACVRPPCVLSP